MKQFKIVFYINEKRFESRWQLCSKYSLEDFTDLNVIMSVYSKWYFEFRG